MAYGTPSQTLVKKLHDLVRRLDKDRRAYDPVSFAQLKRILRRRMGTLAAELRRKVSEDTTRRAA